MSDEECPIAKRIKFESDVNLEVNLDVNDENQDVNDDENRLSHFDVIDEVQGDGSASECGK